jgi:hypothetical protein
MPGPGVCPTAFVAAAVPRGPGFWIEGAAVKTALKFIAGRLSEASTFKGIFLLLTAAGVTLRPELQVAITAAGLALTGLIGVVFPDPVAPAAE